MINPPPGLRVPPPPIPKITPDQKAIFLRSIQPLILCFSLVVFLFSVCLIAYVEETKSNVPQSFGQFGEAAGIMGVTFSILLVIFTSCLIGILGGGRGFGRRR